MIDTIRLINQNGKAQDYPLQIPDLWHAAAYLKRAGYEGHAEEVLKVWHMAHDLLSAVTGRYMGHVDGLIDSADDDEEPCRHVRMIMMHGLLQMLHWANCADVNDKWSYVRNDLDSECSYASEAHGLYGMISRALRDLGGAAAADVYADTGDIEAAHVALNTEQVAA